MTTENWLAVIAISVSISGGLYALIRSDIRGLIKQEIGNLKEELNNERIAKLERENELLRERRSNTK